MEVYHNGVHGWLSKLERHLDGNNPGKLTNKEKKPHAIKFEFDRRIDVDLLISPYWRECSDLYRFLQRIPQGQRFK